MSKDNPVNQDEKPVRKDRDEHGRFVPGHKVESPRAGRPSRADSMPLLIAITSAAYTPEQLVRMLRDTYEMAEKEQDWKGMFTVIQFIANYAIGKPVQRTLSATIDPEQIKRLFAGEEGSSEEGMGGILEGDATVIE